MAEEKRKPKPKRTAKPQPPIKPPKPSPAGAAADYVAQIQAAIPGIPQELATVIGKIISQDPTDAGEGRAFAFLRGTEWFNTAFAGFNQGAGSGLWGGSLNDLVGYRQWRNSIRDNFNQNYGRDASFDEITGFATQGLDAGTVGQIGQGHAIVAANSADWNYLSGAFDTGRFSDSEKEAYGQLLAGRSSDIGIRVQQRLEAAKQKVASLFGGTLASQGGPLPAPGTQKLPDIGA